MTTDRVLTLVALIWFALALLLLFAAGIIHVEASPDPGGDDAPMTCGTWTYYARGVMDRVRQTRGMAPCAECAGMAATVDQQHLGARIEVWFRGAWRGLFLVVDVGNGHNRPGLVGEVGYRVAVEQWGRVAPWWGCYRVLDD